MVPGNPKILCDVINSSIPERAYIYCWWEWQLTPWWRKLYSHTVGRWRFPRDKIHAAREIAKFGTMRVEQLPVWLAYEASIRREIERERRGDMRT